MILEAFALEVLRGEILAQIGVALDELLAERKAEDRQAAVALPERLEAEVQPVAGLREVAMATANTSDGRSSNGPPLDGKRNANHAPAQMLTALNGETIQIYHSVDVFR